MHDGSEHVARDVTATDDYAAGRPAGRRDPGDEGAPGRGRRARRCRKLFGPDTVVVTMQNGIPFWYFHKHGGALEGSTRAQRRPERRARRNDPGRAA